ncbi:MAG: hypothetical protein SGJ00_03570 [bacterium]|nr:hypothetical protein [bacterium]
MTNRTNMENELEGVEEYLRGLPVLGGFKVPHNYLENLVEGFDIAERDLEFKGDGFGVPDGYFVKLEGRVMDSLPKEAKKLSLFSGHRFWLGGIAASMFLVGFVFLWKQEKALVQTEKMSLEIGQVAAVLSVGDLNADLLCDAGWCEELEYLPMVKEGSYEDYLGEGELDLILEEL